METIHEIDGLSAERRTSRRTMLLAIGSGAVAAAAGGATPAFAQVSRGRIRRLSQASDIDILNYILELKYLEATFFSVATTGQPLTIADIRGAGTHGEDFGGAQVAFADPFTSNIGAEAAASSLAQVRLLRSLAGRRAVAKPRINLSALGVGFDNQNSFLAGARALKEAITNAVADAASAIRSPVYRDLVSRMLALDAYQAGVFRASVAAAGIPSPPLGPGDSQPGIGGGVFPGDQNGLTRDVAVGESLDAVSIFFPEGMNGRVR